MRVSIRFHKNSLPLSRVSQPRGVGGSTLRKSDDARRCSGSLAAPDDKRKDVYGRRLRGLKSRKFVNLHRRYGNVTSALGVLYPYGKLFNSRMVCDISTAWADCVAYPLEEAMREPETWDKRK